MSTVTNVVPSLRVEPFIDKRIVRGKQNWVAGISYKDDVFLIGDEYATCDKAREALEPVLVNLSRRISRLIQVTVEGK